MSKKNIVSEKEYSDIALILNEMITYSMEDFPTNKKENINLQENLKSIKSDFEERYSNYEISSEYFKDFKEEISDEYKSMIRKKKKEVENIINHKRNKTINFDSIQEKLNNIKRLNNSDKNLKELKNIYEKIIKELKNAKKKENRKKAKLSLRENIRENKYGYIISFFMGVITSIIGGLLL